MAQSKTPTPKTAREIDVIIRPARVSDLVHIVRLLADDDLGAKRESVGEGNGAPVAECYLTAFDALQCDPNQLQVVAEVAGAVVDTRHYIAMLVSSAPCFAHKTDGVRIIDHHHRIVFNS